MALGACIDRLFDDKRLCVCLLMVWLVVVLIVFKDIGLLDTKFVTFGPSESAVFMGKALNTWRKWGLVAVFTFINTSINDFMSDALVPWMLNTISDHKCKYIPYPKAVCLVISQLWAVYCNIMGVFGLFLSLTQVDFVLIRLAADLTVNLYTNLKFMRNKVYSEHKYHHTPQCIVVEMRDPRSETEIFSINDTELDPPDTTTERSRLTMPSSQGITVAEADGKGGGNTR